MQEQPKIPKKPLLYYVVMVMLVMMLLNIFVFPLLLQPRVTEVDYGTFMSDVEAGKVTEANLDDGYVYYAIPNEKNPKQTDLYMTGQMPNDTGLVDRLYEKGGQILQHRAGKGLSPDELSAHLDPAAGRFRADRAVLHALDAKADGRRRQRDDLRQVQRQNLCAGPDGQDL